MNFMFNRNHENFEKQLGIYKELIKNLEIAVVKRAVLSR